MHRDAILLWRQSTGMMTRRKKQMQRYPQDSLTLRLPSYTTGGGGVPSTLPWNNGLS